MELNTIYNEDCLETMKRMPDDFIDLIVTDPPYGIKASKGTNGFGSAKNRRYEDDWDNATPSQEVFDEMIRVSKQQIIFGGNYFADKLPVSKCWLVWDKKGQYKFKNPFADCELIWTSFSGVVKKFTCVSQGFIKDSKEKTVHPTQKPEKLMRELLETYTDADTLIYDPFMGSGTTAKACTDLGRKYIGSEISKQYCDIAEQRLAEGVLL
jgi:site-specific DNA-methyltransferase (adenine-specific)